MNYEDYKYFLKNQETTISIELEEPKYSNGILVSSGQKKIKIIPPNNCLFNITKIKHIPISKRLIHRQNVISTASRGKQLIPNHFNWKHENKNITPVMNQYLCGCCWAIATATCIADKFVVANLSDLRPKISWTDLISCWINEINNQCKGSNPFMALQYIQYNGIGFRKSYNWCKDSKICNPPMNENSNVDISQNDLNLLVPKCTKSFSKGKKFFIHKIKGVPLTIYNLNDENLEASIMMVKKHILKFGPIIGGYFVYSNFKSGKFTCKGKNPSNIYLENVDYETSNYQLLDISTCIGCHAVVIIGWGTGLVQESLLKPNSTSTNMIPINYWIVRNSWGKDWGSLNGYFHIAQYPINKHSQFEVSNIITTTVQDPKTNLILYEKELVSGLILFKPFHHNKSLEMFLSDPSRSFNSTNEIVYFFILIMIFLTLILFIIILIYRNN